MTRNGPLSSLHVKILSLSSSIYPSICRLKVCRISRSLCGQHKSAPHWERHDVLTAPTEYSTKNSQLGTPLVPFFLGRTCNSSQFARGREVGREQWLERVRRLRRAGVASGERAAVAGSGKVVTGYCTGYRSPIHPLTNDMGKCSVVCAVWVH